jgi:hypothetical protein
MKDKGDDQDHVHLDQMVPVIVRQISWTVQAVAKGTQSKLNIKGNYQAPVHSDQMVIVVVRQGGWTAGAMAIDAQMKVEK